MLNLSFIWVLHKKRGLKVTDTEVYLSNICTNYQGLSLERHNRQVTLIEDYSF